MFTLFTLSPKGAAKEARLFRFLFLHLITSAPTPRKLSFRGQRGTCCRFSFFRLVTRHSPLATSPSSFTSHERRIRSAGNGRAEFIPARSGERLSGLFLFSRPFLQLCPSPHALYATRTFIALHTAHSDQLATCAHSARPAAHLTTAIPANSELAAQLATCTSAAHSPACTTRFWRPRQLGRLDSP